MCHGMASVQWRAGGLCQCQRPRYSPPLAPHRHHCRPSRRLTHCCAASDSIERRILTLKRQIPFLLCSSYTHERKSKAADGRTDGRGKTHAQPRQQAGAAQGAQFAIEPGPVHLLHLQLVRASLHSVHRLHPTSRRRRFVPKEDGRCRDVRGRP